MRLRFDARARAIFRRLPVINVYSATELVLLAALAVQGARLMWAVVTPLAPLGAWQPVMPAAPADAAAVLASFDPFTRASGQAGQPAAAPLQLTLFGTRIDAAHGGGSAILAGPDGEQKSIAVGEEAAPGVLLKAVAFDHVTLERGGTAQDLFIDQAGQGVQATGAAPVAPTPGAPPPPSASISAQQLRGDLSAIPRIEGGRISGVVVRGQGGSAFGAAGLRDGDVVTAIGGKPIAGPQDLERLNGENGSVALMVERGGQTLPLSIAVTK